VVGCCSYTLSVCWLEVVVVSRLPPTEVLERAGIDPGDVDVLDSRIPNWRVTVAGHLAVLKRDWHLDVADITWEHAFLTRLADTGFPAPRPVAAFAGQSWSVVNGGLWTLASFQTGRTLARADQPDLAAVGRFIARYHDAVEQIEAPMPRPLVPNIDGLAALAPWDRLDQTLGGANGVRQFRWHLEQTADELANSGHLVASRLLIHGDFTTDNILIDGEPPTIVGAIDFALTSREPPLADLAFGLWRTGRPTPDAMALDVQRVAAMVAGYATVQNVPAETARAVPAYLKARGLQLIVRASRAGASDCSPALERVGRIAAQQDDLQGALIAALERL
jgi:Ser/Thr protein kinase RdoA (MazF antagonist)